MIIIYCFHAKPGFLLGISVFHMGKNIRKILKNLMNVLKLIVDRQDIERIDHKRRDFHVYKGYDDNRCDHSKGR